jgi:hypothetical protein
LAFVQKTANLKSVNDGGVGNEPLQAATFLTVLITSKLVFSEWDPIFKTR